MKPYLLLLFALLVPATASGNCADGYYILKGKVVLQNDKPAVGAIVGASWVESGRPGGPAIGKSDAKGNFVLYVHFYKYSGTYNGGDACDGKLTEVSLHAYTDKLESFAYKLSVTPTAEGVINVGTFPISSRRLEQ